MSDINISVDSSQVVGGKKALDDFGIVFAKLVTRLVRDEKTIQRALKAPWEQQAEAVDQTVKKVLEAASVAARENQKIVNSNLGVTNSYKSATTSAEAFLEVLRNQERLARQSTDQFNQSIGISGPSAAQSGATFSAMEGEIERLTQKYNQIYASSRLYETSLNELSRAHMLGVMNTKQHEAAVESLNMEYQQFQAGTAGFGNRFAMQGQEAARSTNQLGVVVQQTGYQVGDFLVQVQGGTNWMVAFGQQATQLVGVLPLLSSTLGMSAGRLIAMSTGLGIAIPLATALGAAWMRTRKDTDEASKGVKTLDDSLKSLDQTLAQWVLTKRAAESGLTVEQLLGSQSIDKALSDMKAAEVAYNKLLASIEAQNKVGGFGSGVGPGAQAGAAIYNLFALGNTVGDLEAAEAAYASSVERVGVLQSKISSERIANYKEEQATLRETQEIELATILYGKESAQVKDLIASKERRIYEASLSTRSLNETMVSLLMRQYDEKVKLITAAENWKTRVSQVKSILESINGMQLQVGLKINTVVEGLPDFAKGIWDKMREIAWQGDLRGNETASKRPPKAPPMLGEPELNKRGRSGSGGGDKDNGRLESLIAELQTERETLEIWYEESQLLLEAASAKELEMLGGKNEAKLRLEQEYQSRLKEILGQEKNYRLSEMGSMFGALADLAGVGGKKMLRVQATLSAAATTIAAYETAVKAAAEAKTLPGRIAAYAKFLAVGLGAVSKIKSAGGIGGGGGGGGGSPSSAAVSAPQAPEAQSVYLENIDPNNLYTGEMLIRLFEALYSENDKRGKVFVVRS